MGMIGDETKTIKKLGGRARCVHHKREDQLLRDISLHPPPEKSVVVSFDRIDDPYPSEQRVVRLPECDFCRLVKYDAPRPCYHMRDYISFMIYALDDKTPPKRGLLTWPRTTEDSFRFGSNRGITGGGGGEVAFYDDHNDADSVLPPL